MIASAQSNDQRVRDLVIFLMLRSTRFGTLRTLQRPDRLNQVCAYRVPLTVFRKS